jgi:diguanylate cyclase (GGDEF)-like protein
MKILCVEDDESFAKLLQRSLVKQHYQVDLAPDGQLGWDLIETSAYDLILLDWMLPKLTGIEFCRRLRAENRSMAGSNRDTPILLMTALDAVTHKVVGLNAGADDYVVKPFDLEELLARVRALLRRGQGARSPLLQWGGLCLNSNSCKVTYHGQPILLAAKEYELLELFLRNPDQIFSLDRLLLNLWAVAEAPSEGAVRAHVKGLRQKLKHAGASDPIETIYKLGYRLKQQKELADKGLGDERDNANIAPSSLIPHPSISPSPSSPPSSPSISPDLWTVWQECRQSYCDRLSMVQDALTALQRETLTLEQQEKAAQEAHTLTGSLGSFGLYEASRISRQIQQILKQQDPLGTLELEELTQLITALRLYLEDSQQEETTSQQEKISSQREKTREIAKPLKQLSPTPLETTLLIVDDDLPLAQLLAKEALSRGLQAKIATTLHDAQHWLHDSSVKVMLLDINLSASAENGLEFLATVRHQRPELPVVMLTAEETFENRVEAARLGSCCFLQKPIAATQVLTAVTQVLQQMNQAVDHILIVDDDPALLRFLSTLLEPCGYRVTSLSEPQHFWQTLEQTTPDLLILDVELCEPSASNQSKATIPSLSGIELCQVIRSDLRWNRLPVLFLSAHTDIETIQRSFAVGADDFLSKPVVAPELLTRVQTRLEQRKLWGAVDRDELTGVSLRRKALPDLTQLIRLAHRQQQPFSLAVLDLDHFKRVNDQYGHEAGDQVLSYLGKLLQHSFRQEDIVGRWGGEEFIVGMYGITKQDGVKRLQAILRQLKQHVFLAHNGRSFQVTFSAGIAQFSEDGHELQALCHCADFALYQAKSAGRNQIFAVESPQGNRLDSTVHRQKQESS